MHSVAYRRTPLAHTTTAILPIDTVKSIVQSQEGPARSAVGVATGLWKYVSGFTTDSIVDHTLIYILKSKHRSGGMPAFYRGLTPALVRAFPTSAATFSAYESTLKFLDRL